MSTSAIAERQLPGEILEKLVQGDLSKLQPHERVAYMLQVCNSLGLNPATAPFEFISLSGKLRLYAKKDATDQLRRLHRVSISIKSQTAQGDLWVVQAQATTPDGRADEEIGAVSIKGLAGEHLANALMKASTKAKRRVTLSICGLGFLDESEVESIPDAQPVQTQQPQLQALPAPAAAPQAQQQPFPAELWHQVDAAWKQLQRLELSENATKKERQDLWAALLGAVKAVRREDVTEEKGRQLLAIIQTRVEKAQSKARRSGTGEPTPPKKLTQGQKTRIESLAQTLEMDTADLCDVIRHRYGQRSEQLLMPQDLHDTEAADLITHLEEEEGRALAAAGS